MLISRACGFHKQMWNLFLHFCWLRSYDARLNLTVCCAGIVLITKTGLHVSVMLSTWMLKLHSVEIICMCSAALNALFSLCLYIWGKRKMNLRNVILFWGKSFNKKSCRRCLSVNANYVTKIWLCFFFLSFFLNAIFIQIYSGPKIRKTQSQASQNMFLSDSTQFFSFTGKWNTFFFQF